MLQIYTDWANHYLAKSGHKRLIKDLQQDVTDGVLLAQIIQVVGKGSFYVGNRRVPAATQEGQRGGRVGQGDRNTETSKKKPTVSVTCVDNLFD